MPFGFQFPGFIKENICKHFLQNYVGEFLVDELSLDQLSVEIFKGTGLLQNVQLNSEAVNAKLEKAGVPLMLVDGFVESISVSIPWSSLLTDDTSVQITGVELTLQPHQSANSSSSDLDASQWLSQSQMSTTSLHLAEECLKDEPASKSLPDGLDAFAKTIESVLSRIRVTLVDTVIRLESCPPEASQGIALELHIGKIEYFDESSKDLGTSVDEDRSGAHSDSSLHSIKNIHISGDISLYTDIFLPCHRSRAHNPSDDSLSSMSSDIFSSALSSHSPIMRQPSYMSSSGNAEGLPQEHNTFNSEPVKFLMATGEQRVKLKIKNNDKVPGPKSSVEVQLSSIGIFLIPKQISLLSELVKAYTDAVDSHTPSKQKYLGLEEFDVMETTLQHQMMLGSPTSRLLDPGLLDLENLGLGEAAFDTLSMDSGMFHSVKGDRPTSKTDIMSTSIYSGYSGTLPTSTTPSTYLCGSERTYTGSTPRRHASPGFTSRPTSERFDETKTQLTISKVNIAFLVAVLLNENTTAAPQDPLESCRETDMEKLKRKSDSFLEGLSSHRSRGVVELLDIRRDIETYCSDSHVKLITKKVLLDVKQKSQQVGRRKKAELNVDLSISQCEVTEWVVPDSKIRTFAPIHQQPTCEILTFTSEVSNSVSSKQPCIKVQYNTTSSSSRTSEDVVKQKSNMSIMLCKQCSLEVDISITDRLKDLLNPSPSGFERHTDLHSSATSNSLRNSEPPPVVNVDFSILSESDVNLYLRFPIADLRKDLSQKFSWWRRNLRQEILELQISKPRFKTNLPSANEIEFTCRSARAFFLMCAGGERIAFANIGQELGDKDGLESPRLVVKTFPCKLNSLLEEDVGDSSFDSLNGACSEIKTADLSPFSRQKAMINENEELRIPGTRREMTDFELQTKSNTQLSIQLDLPAVNIIAPNKHMFELLYNRVCNDLLLWESLAPVPSTVLHKMGSAGFEQELTDFSQYMPYKSAFYSHSTEDDEDVDDFDEEMLYSIHGKFKQTKYRSSAVARHGGQSKSCVSINIKRGRLSLIHPSTGADKTVISQDKSYGQSTLDIYDAVIYVNSKSMGDPNLGYIAIHGGQSTLYHDGCIAGEYCHPNHVERLVSTAPANLPLVLDLCSPRIPSKMGDSTVVGSKGNEDMLSIAIKINLDPDHKKHVKYIDIAIALRRACLHHKVVESSQMWISQLMKFLAVDDYDVLGYPFPKVFTELHFHVLGSAISYIPNNLQLGGLLTLEKFSISSNVIVNSPVSLLAFSVEDAAFYLSDSSKRHHVNVKEDYVCLIELNFFHLDWKSTDGKNPKYPKSDICIKCSTLHIKTCSDSCKALQKFIVYIAEDGDLPPPTPPPTSPPTFPPSSPPGIMVATIVPNQQPLTSEELENSTRMTASTSQAPDSTLPNLMEDAMEDIMTTSIYPVPQEKQTYPPEMFLYQSSRDGEGEGTEQVRYEEDVEVDEDDDDEDDFCFVGYSDIPKDDDPLIEYEDKDAIQVKDNYFAVPTGRINLLNPPKNFPDAVCRYCLSNLTIVWSVYGGRDFGKRDPTRNTKYTDRSRGGAARDPDKFVELQLSKIQLHWEVYPDNTLQVSRRCLMIDEVEVRDLVKESEVNKMLYQYSSSSAPRQQHTSMVSLKMVTHRQDMTQLDHRHESDVRVSVQPIRINLDQDALNFLEKFVRDILNEGGAAPMSTSFTYNAAEETGAFGQTPVSNSPPSDEPIMTMSVLSPSDREEGRVMFDEMSEDDEAVPKEPSNPDTTLFIKNFVFTPDVPIRLDYIGRHIDMKRLQGIAFGLAQLNKAELRLKSLYIKQGTLGLEKLLHTCINEWKRDITKSQIPRIIGGVGPLNSFVQFFQGLQSLVWLPIEQYRKDGRIVRGLQKGANAFSSSTTVAVVELTNRAVQTIQVIAELSYDLVSPGTAATSHSRYRKIQPRDLMEGVNQACAIGKEDITNTVQNVYRSAAKETELKGFTGTVGGMARQVPSLALRPVITTTNMASNVLIGIRNQMDPDAHKEDVMKYKTK